MTAGRQRVDKWLFFARVVKSRTLAAKLTQSGYVRVNGAKISQASHEVRPDDVLTVALDRRVVVCKVLDCGTRRGPASEARLLYEDMSPPQVSKPDSALDRIPAREPGAGRPTKKERRALDRLHGEGD